MTFLEQGAEQEKKLDILPLTPKGKFECFELPMSEEVHSNLESNYPSGNSSVYVAPKDIVELH